MKMRIDEKNTEVSAEAGSSTEYGSLEVVNIRLVKEPSILSSKQIRCTDDAVEVITEQLSAFDREVFGVLNLSSKGTPICFNVVSIGTLTESYAAPREVYKSAVLSNASAILAFHCHPSGCPEPSQADIITTQRLQQAGEIMGVKMIDHIIVGCGTGDHISFAARGMLTENFDLDAAVREPKIMEDLKKDWQDLTGKEQDLKSQIKKLKRREAFER